MAHTYEATSSDTVFTGRVVSLRRDIVSMPGGTTSQRDVVVHPGAVGVVALQGDQVLLVNQYRHPVGRRLDELPAGLLDVDGEPALQCAQRELMEVIRAHWRGTPPPPAGGKYSVTRRTFTVSDRSRRDETGCSAHPSRPGRASTAARAAITPAFAARPSWKGFVMLPKLAISRRPVAWLFSG